MDGDSYDEGYDTGLSHGKIEAQAEIERLNTVVAYQQQAIEAIFDITEERLVDWGAVRKIKNDYLKITAKHKQEKE